MGTITVKAKIKTKTAKAKTGTTPRGLNMEICTAPSRQEEVAKQKIRSAAARAAHEANRAWCIAHGDDVQPPWEEAPLWQIDSALKGVDNVMLGTDARNSHKCWMAEKKATGWKYGPVKDVSLKEHPCMVDYEELPEAQKAKDHIFVSVVRAFLHAAKVPVAGFQWVSET